MEQLTNTAAEKIINSSNDNTFNVVVDYRRYNDDKYTIVVKNGGIVTANSISKPKFKLITNIDVEDGIPPHVVEFDSLQKAFDYIDNHQELEKLPDSSQAYFKPIIKNTIGNAVFMSNHTNTGLLNGIRKAAIESISDVAIANNISEQIDNIAKLTRDVRDRVSYSWGIKQFDKLTNSINKMHKQIDTTKIKTACNLYNNFICRYD